MDENLRLIIIAIGGPALLVLGLYVSGIALKFFGRFMGGESGPQEDAARLGANSRDTQAQLMKRQLLDGQKL